MQTADHVLEISTRAVEGDSADALRARWDAGLARNPEDRAARLGLANLDLLTYRYEQALTAYDRLIAGADNPPGPFVRRALLGRANLLRIRSEFGPSGPAYEEAIRAAEPAQDTAVLAEALVGLALSRLRTDGPGVADSILSMADDLVSVHDRQRANLQCMRVSILGLPAVHALEGAALARRVGSERIRARCLWAAMGAYMARGISDSAQIMADSAVEGFRTLRVRYSLSAALQWRGWYRSNVGNYGGARDDLSDALLHAEASGNESATAWASLGLAGLLLRLGDAASTKRHLERALELFRRQGDRAGLASARSIQTGLAHLSGSRVEDPTDQVVGGDAAIGADLAGAVSGYLNRASWALEDRDPDRAAEAVDSALALARANGMTGWERAAELARAPVAVAQGRLTEAERILEVAILRPEQPPRRFGLRALLGGVYALQNRLDLAEDLIVEASERLDEWREELSDHELRVRAFELSELDRGVATVVTALAEGGRIASAFEIAERRRARELLDRMLQARAMQGVAEDSRASPARPSRNANSVGLAELQGIIPDDRTAVLHYVTGVPPEPSALFVITRQSAAVVRLPSVDALRTVKDRLVALIRSPLDVRSLSPSLSTPLLGDALDRLPDGVERLVIVPDDALHHVPFDALPLGGGSIVIDRFVTSLAPSATVAARLWTVRASADRVDGAEGNTGAGLLALGDPDFSPVEESESPAARDYRQAFADAGGLPPLPGSGREARVVSRFTDRAELLTGLEASEAALKRRSLERYDVLHLATHALVDPRAVTRTALALSPGDGEDGFLGPADLAELKLAADLVVLSACRTGSGVVVRGEGIQGITAPLLEAGARAVVATRWLIDDDRTVALFDEFYKALADGDDVGQALRSAKLAVEARGVPASEWTAFTLIGDPTVRVALRHPRHRLRVLVFAALVLSLGTLVLLLRRRGARATGRTA